MSARKYDEDFKKSIVTLYQTGKSQSQLSKKYGSSLSTVSIWVKQYSEVKLDDNSVISAHQIKELQKKKYHAWREEFNIQKSYCHIHSALSERWKAVHVLRFQHSIKTLCRVLKVTRSTCYKHFSSAPSAKEI